MVYTPNSSKWSTHRTVQNDLHTEQFKIVYTQNSSKWSTHRTVQNDLHTEQFKIIYTQNSSKWSTHRTVQNDLHTEKFKIIYTQNSSKWSTHRTVQNDLHTEQFKVRYARTEQHAAGRFNGQVPTANTARVKSSAVTYADPHPFHRPNTPEINVLARTESVASPSSPKRPLQLISELS